MNARLETLAREREDLLARSALGRRRLRREAQYLRNAVGWRPILATAVSTPATRGVLLAIALSALGLVRTTRVVMLAGRALLIARAARFALQFVQHRVALPARRPGTLGDAHEDTVRYRTDRSGISP